MSEDTIEYLPFHAVNEFMLPDYRQQVIHHVLGNLDQLDGPRRGALIGLVRKLVSVPGFRNSAHAPLPLKMRGVITPFEKNPDFVAQILAAWSDLNPELRNQVYSLLTSRKWNVLPAEADRSKLPGFTTEWDEAETFAVLDEAFRKENPDVEASDDDINLMIVWLSNRLPYNLYPSEAEETTEDE